MTRREAKRCSEVSQAVAKRRGITRRMDLYDHIALLSHIQTLWGANRQPGVTLHRIGFVHDGKSYQVSAVKGKQRPLSKFEVLIQEASELLVIEFETEYEAIAFIAKGLGHTRRNTYPLDAYSLTCVHAWGRTSFRIELNDSKLEDDTPLAARIRDYADRGKLLLGDISVAEAKADNANDSSAKKEAK